MRDNMSVLVGVSVSMPRNGSSESVQVWVLEPRYVQRCRALAYGEVATNGEVATTPSGTGVVGVIARPLPPPPPPQACSNPIARMRRFDLARDKC